MTCRENILSNIKVDEYLDESELRTNIKVDEYLDESELRTITLFCRKFMSPTMIFLYISNYHTLTP